MTMYKDHVKFEMVLLASPSRVFTKDLANLFEMRKHTLQQGSMLAAFKITTVAPSFQRCGFPGLRFALKSSGISVVMLLDKEIWILLRKSHEDRALPTLQDHIHEKRPKLSEMWK